MFKHLLTLVIATSGPESAGLSASPILTVLQILSVETQCKILLHGAVVRFRAVEAEMNILADYFKMYICTLFPGADRRRARAGNGELDGGGDSRGCGAGIDTSQY